MDDFLNCNYIHFSIALVSIFILVLLEALCLKRNLLLKKEKRLSLIAVHCSTILWLCITVLPIASVVMHLDHQHIYFGNLWWLRLLSGTLSLLLHWFYTQPTTNKPLIYPAIVLGTIEGLGVYPFWLALIILFLRQYRLHRLWTKKIQLLQARKEKIEQMLFDLENSHKEEIANNLHHNLHDLIGQRLAALEQTLQQEQIDYAKLYPLLNNLTKSIKLKPLQSPATTLTGLIRTYKTIGLNVHIKGQLPKDQELAQVFVDFISEGVNNAVRHGNATNIEVTITSGSAPVISLSNNGKAEKELQPGKGLRSVQHRLNSVGYSLDIKPSPIFTITGKERTEND